MVFMSFRYCREKNRSFQSIDLLFLYLRGQFGENFMILAFDKIHVSLLSLRTNSSNLNHHHSLFY